VQVTNCKDKVLPIRVIYLLQKLLVDQRSKRFIQACLETFRWLIRNLDHFLKKTKRELIVRLACDPKSEVFVGPLDIGIVESNDHLLGLLHELEAKLAVLKNDPSSSLHARLDCLSRRLFLALSH
jgi:hypothetical protein